MTNDVGIGKLIDSAQQRDAIHVAIAPVVATCKLIPGQDIGFTTIGDMESVGVTDKPIGIVDPFLTRQIFPGQRFWMFLYPNTIESLRHDWTHPAFQTAITSAVDDVAGNEDEEDWSCSC